MKESRKFFWDVDETLIHTEACDFPESTHSFELDDGEYFTAIRPEAKEVIELTREIFGAENVFILSTATKDYLREVNRLGEWGFPDNQIFSREDLRAHAIKHGGAWGHEHTETLGHGLAHETNLLVDNLPPRYNESKIGFLGIRKTKGTNYLQVRDYYGVNFPDNGFVDSIRKFILAK